MENVLQMPASVKFQVQQTTDYDLFSFLQGNRNVNMVQVKRLVTSMSEVHLFSPIIVNEKLQIIDGQHRYLASKELKLPVYYIIVENYGLKEVQILNTNSTNWKKLDYLKGYMDLGLRPYIQLKEFMDLYPDFAIKSTLHILKATSKGKYIDKGLIRTKSFESGDLIIPDLAYSKKIASMIMDYRTFYKSFYKISFVAGCMSIIEHENYNHEEMMTKLKRLPNQITDQPSAIRYRLLLEDIFNYHRRQKVSLRF